MTKSISSASAKGTLKMADEPDTSGTPPTETTSEDTSGGFTEWTVKVTTGERFVVTLPGDGRISYGRSASRDGAEVRFYRNQSSKHYDAVIPGVLSIYSQRVDIRPAPKLKAEEEREKADKLLAEMREKKRADKMLAEVSEMIVRRDYAEGSSDF